MDTSYKTYRVTCKDGWQKGWFCDVCEKCHFRAALNTLRQLPIEDDEDAFEMAANIDCAVDEAEARLCRACQAVLFGYPREQAHCNRDCKNCGHAFAVVTMRSNGGVNCSGDANPLFKRIK